MASIDGWRDMGYKEILLSGAILIIGGIGWLIILLIIQINRFSRAMMEK